MWPKRRVLIVRDVLDREECGSCNGDHCFLAFMFLRWCILILCIYDCR